MLRKLSADIRHAQERAAYAAEQARQAANAEEQREWLALERSWMQLAQSFDVSERIEVFIRQQECRR
jgi:hypothetical protein